MVVAHGITAVAIVALLPWKSVIVARGLTRRRSGRAVSILLSTLVVSALASGFALVTGVVDSIGPLTTMQVHVGTAVGAIVSTLAHVWQRPTSHRTLDLDRRNLLRAGGLLAGASALWLLVEQALDVAHLPGAGRRFTGSHEISEPAEIPATQWTNDQVQHLDAGTHVVDIGGVRWTVQDLDGSEGIRATLDCTGGWYTTQMWTGTRLDRTLDVGAGRSLVVRSATGYWRRFPADQASSLWIATRVAGMPLPDGNGGPVRLVAPHRRGYWWVKWLDSIEVDDRPPWWQPPLPLA